ncbi:MAG: hypothetical protein H6828_16200 [Planctomycetes bacterium]|nr:hypothetical protein [Planctomycetota bacterium]
MEPPLERATPSPGTAVQKLRREVREVGTQLAQTFGSLLGSLEGRPRRPRTLADALGITTVTASRLLRAVALADPVAVVLQIPGTVPLRRVLDAAEAAGGAPELVERGREAVARFEQLVRGYAGDRSSLDAMLSDWLPGVRREFEVRRRQAVYKSLSELKGLSSELELATIAVHPSQLEQSFDLLSIMGIFGLDRLRPDTPFHLGTLRDVSGQRTAKGEPRRGPHTLDGEPALEGYASVRLDEFCHATPAPLRVRQIGEFMQYSLGETGLGPDSSVDLVVADLNVGEVPNHPGALRTPTYYHIPSAPAQELLFDLLLHRDVYPGHDPALLVYDTTVRGPARGQEPTRDLDLMSVSESIEFLGDDPARRRFAGYPRYLELLDHAFGKLGWKPEDFRAYRFHMSYPLCGTQVCMSFTL